MSEQDPTPEVEQDETEATEVEAHAAEDVLDLQKLDADKGTPLGVAFSGGSCAAASC